ncbi:MAG TPA: hypothetical protein PLF13_07965 [candidate division Zixibacteria bacterium]|nr:hypothetical protein [candidate division Zixibacteria bacterium]
MRKLYICLISLLLTAGLIQAREPIAYVVNTAGETLSKINLATGQITANLLTLGSSLLSQPNQIIVRDTLAYVLNSGTDEIQLIDLNSESTVGYIDFPSGCSPYWMAFYDDSMLFVTGFVSGNLYHVNVMSGAVVASIPVGESPEGVEIKAGKVFVAVSGFNQSTWEYDQGILAVVDPSGDSLLNRIEVGTNPQYTATDGLGRLHVVCTGDYWSVFGKVYVVDPSNESVVDSIDLGGYPGMVAVTPDNMGYIAAGGWVDEGEVMTYNAATGEVYHGSSNPLPVDSGCMMVIPYQDTTCFVGTFRDYVTSIDSSGTELARYAVGDGPVYLAVNYLPGDINGSYTVDITDLVMMVTYMFQQGQLPPWPRWRMNVNGMGGVDISDLVYLVGYMFQHGPAPRVGATWKE